MSSRDLSPSQKRRIGLAPFADGYEVGGLAARLIGVPFPSTAFFSREPLEGVRWVACLASENPQVRYSTKPLEFLCRVKLDSPLGGGHEVAQSVASIARQIDNQLRLGLGVLVHCDMGIERTGAVIGTVMALAGVEPRRAADQIADIIEYQQPGWAGPNFAHQLSRFIDTCVRSGDSSIELPK